MSAKPQLYSEKTVQSLEQQLEQLAAHPKGSTLRGLIERLKPRIRAAQAAGHTYEDIVKALSESGVLITVNTLKQYLREPRTGTDGTLPFQGTAPATTHTTPARRMGKRQARLTRSK